MSNWRQKLNWMMWVENEPVIYIGNDRATVTDFVKEVHKELPSYQKLELIEKILTKEKASVIEEIDEVLHVYYKLRSGITLGYMDEVVNFQKVT